MNFPPVRIHSLRLYLSILVLVLFTVLVPLRSLAENYAVLVGVNQFQEGGGNLQGPVYDVSGMRDALMHTGFKPENIHVLLDSDATRGKVLATLAQMVARARAGDQVVFYFSGHGTSGWDSGNPGIAQEIGTESGAVLPYDLKKGARAFDTLIVGRRDLRPILSRLNPQATAIVILDSCFSENSAKDLDLNTQRVIPADDLLGRGLVIDQKPASAQSATTGAPAATGAGASSVAAHGHGIVLDLGPVDPPATTSAGRNADDLGPPSEPGSPATGPRAVRGRPTATYPYPNVISLSAASKDETAADIGRESIANGTRTFDGRPHGAFTDGLLRAMNAQSRGRLSVDRLFRTARENVRTMPHIKQMPQLLQPDGDIASMVGFGGVLDAPSVDANVFPDGSPIQPAAPAPPYATTRIQFSGIPDALGFRLTSIPGVIPVASTPDLTLKYVSPGFALFDRNGSLIHRYTPDEIDDLAARVAVDGQMRHLADDANWPHDFDLNMDVAWPVHQGTYYAGQKLTVTGATPVLSYPLALDIASNGQITILTANIDGPLQPGKPREMYKGLVGAPYGSDSLVVFGFQKKPASYDRWLCHQTGSGEGTCPQLQPGTPDFDAFLAFLAAQKKTGLSHAVLRISTAEAPPVLR